MTAIPAPHDHLLTVDEYARFGEDDRNRWELQQGTLVRFPTPTLRHMIAVGELALRLRRQLPTNLDVVPAADINLELAPAEEPGWCRKPDLIIVDREAADRAGSTGDLLRAADVIVAVEVLSSASRQVDHLVKRHEYARAGIPYYWIIDLEPPVSVTICHLDEFGYSDGGSVTGEFVITDPFDLRVDLDRLRLTASEPPRATRHARLT